MKFFLTCIKPTLNSLIPYKVKNRLVLFSINFIAIVIAYYVSLLLHEWGHGTLAWLNHIKSSPFDVTYGGWLLMHADENVAYDSLIASGHGIAAALIGIAGFTVSFIILITAFYFLIKLNKGRIRLTLTYWFVIISMIPIIQYLTVSPFSTEGDTGRFVHGLTISPLWVFLPGTIFVILMLWKILTVGVPKIYALMPIKSSLGQQFFLLLTLSFLFLFIYTHGYNPLTDEGMTTFSKIVAMFSIICVPILLVICNPARDWMKKSMQKYLN